MPPLAIVHLSLALLLAPLLPGVINRTKAVIAGRRGPPLWQGYYDLAKLLRKDVVYSTTTTLIFRAAPAVVLGSSLAALTLLPFANTRALLAFPGDLLFFVYLLGLARFALMAGALDTGSSFQGMGAGREVTFSALAEPALLLGLIAMARESQSLSLSEVFARLGPVSLLQGGGPALLLVAAAFVIVYLSENARIPFDDPNTHLELTMIHEVMVLDYSGPDLAFILYGAALKLWVLGAVIVNILISILNLGHFLSFLVFIAGMFLLAIITGVIESTMARFKLLKVPRLLIVAVALSVLAFTLIVRFTS
jgi:formate hydrogenlyase subunit 4